MSQIQGRRLDGFDKSSLVMFRPTVEPRGFSIPMTPKPATNSDVMNIKRQDQRADIEKLKFHREDPKLTIKTTNSQTQKGDKVKPKSTVNDRIAENARRKEAAALNSATARASATTLRKSSNPLVTAEARTRKAAEWLQNEKKEVGILGVQLYNSCTHTNAHDVRISDGGEATSEVAVPRDRQRAGAQTAQCTAG